MQGRQCAQCTGAAGRSGAQALRARRCALPWPRPAAVGPHTHSSPMVPHWVAQAVWQEAGSLRCTWVSATGMEGSAWLAHAISQGLPYTQWKVSPWNVWRPHTGCQACSRHLARHLLSLAVADLRVGRGGGGGA